MTKKFIIKKPLIEIDPLKEDYFNNLMDIYVGKKAAEYLHSNPDIPKEDFLDFYGNCQRILKIACKSLLTPCVNPDSWIWAEYRKYFHPKNSLSKRFHENDTMIWGLHDSQVNKPITFLEEIIQGFHKIQNGLYIISIVIIYKTWF